MKIFAYLRVSTSMQVDSGAGIAAQLDSCTKWAQAQGTSLTKVFTEEAISGAAEIDKRPALLSLVSELSKGDIMLVARWDRVGRSELPVAVIESIVTGKGAKIVSVAGEGTQDTDELSAFLQNKIAKLFAEYERMITRIRIKSAMKSMKERGKRIGYIPFGCRLTSDGKHLEADEAEQKILAQICALKKKGLSVRKIANVMNSRSSTNRGAPWSYIAIFRLTKKIAAAKALPARPEQIAPNVQRKTA
jgi:DNA invertase Pin-like site-specific DNA recombinase